MANFFDIDDVRARMPGGAAIDDQSGPPTTTQVTNWCTQVTNVLNRVLKASGVTGTITDTDLLGELKLKGAGIVAYYVVVVRKIQLTKDDQLLVDRYRDEFDALIDEIKAGEFSPAADTQDPPWSYLMGSSYGTVSSDPSIDPTIGKATRY